MQWSRIDVHRRLIVGLGAQWTPSSDSATTFQLCVGNLCLTLQLRHIPHVPLQLRRFLSESNHTFVGVWDYNDQNMSR